MKSSKGLSEPPNHPLSSKQANQRAKVTSRLLDLLALEREIDAQIARLRERKAQTKTRIESARVKLAGKQLELGFAAKRRRAA